MAKRLLSLSILLLLLGVGTNTSILAQRDSTVRKVIEEMEYLLEKRRGDELYQKLLVFDSKISYKPIKAPQGALIWEDIQMYNQSPLLCSKEEKREIYQIIIDKEIRPYIEENIREYAQQISNKMGLDVRIATVNSDAKAYYIREKLKENKKTVKGCLFVGDVPFTLFQEKTKIEKEKNVFVDAIVYWPCDLYYMDLDGKWEDKMSANDAKTDWYKGHDDVFDTHRGNIDPEIFVGRIPYYYDAPAKENSIVINRYLERLIRFWKKNDGVMKLSLSYIDKDWSNEDNDQEGNIFRLVGFVNDVRSFKSYPEFSSKDYSLLISLPWFSYVRLFAHSNPKDHEFGRGKEIVDKLWHNEIYHKKVHPRLFNLFCCSALRWTEGACLGAAYIYGENSKTMAVVGSTKVGSMYNSTEFNLNLALSSTVGDAIINWWKRHRGYPRKKSRDFIHWHYGLTIFGDPLVQLMPPVDLYMKDDEDDEGVTPYKVDEEKFAHWESPALWVRNKRDNVEEHQNPIYRFGKPVYVYARIHNRGIRTSQPAQLQLRWSHAGISLNYDSFLGKHFKEGVQTGGNINTQPIYVPPIKPGQSVVVCTPWYIPNPKTYDHLTKKKGDWHYCMLGEVSSPEDPMIDPYSSFEGSLPQNDNNVVMKNIYQIEIDEDDSFFEGYISIRNPYKDEHQFVMVVDGREMNNPQRVITEVATVSLELNDNSYMALRRGGNKLENMTLIPSEKRLVLNSDLATASSLSLHAEEMGLVNVKFNFKAEQAEQEGKYQVRVLFKDQQTGKLLGGETYRIKKKARPSFKAVVTEEIKDGKSILVAQDIKEPAHYRWRDENNEVIAEGKELAKNDITSKLKLEIEAKKDGVTAVTIVENLTASSETLFKVYPNPIKDEMMVEYNGKDNTKATLAITSIANGNSVVLPLHTSSTRIDTRSYPRGKYIVSLVVNGISIAEQIIEMQ